MVTGVGLAKALGWKATRGGGGFQNKGSYEALKRNFSQAGKGLHFSGRG
jgi:hypothetical protein